MLTRTRKQLSYLVDLEVKVERLMVDDLEVVFTKELIRVRVRPPQSSSLYRHIVDLHALMDFMVSWTFNLKKNIYVFAIIDRR